VSIYRFIAAERATFGTKMLCAHLGGVELGVLRLGTAPAVAP